MDSQYPVHHRFVFRAVNDVACRDYGLDFKVGDEIDCYEVFKNGPEIVREAFGQAGLKELGSWTAPSGTFREFSLPSSTSDFELIRMQTSIFLHIRSFDEMVDRLWRKISGGRFLCFRKVW